MQHKYGSYRQTPPSGQNTGQVWKIRECFSDRWSKQTRLSISVAKEIKSLNSGNGTTKRNRSQFLSLTFNWVSKPFSEKGFPIIEHLLVMRYFWGIAFIIFTRRIVHFQVILFGEIELHFCCFWIFIDFVRQYNDGYLWAILS